MNLTRVAIFAFSSIIVGSAGAFVGIRDPQAGKNISRFIGNAANIGKELTSLEIFKEIQDLWNSPELNCLIAKVSETKLFGIVVPNIAMVNDRAKLEKVYSFLKSAKETCNSSKAVKDLV